MMPATVDFKSCLNMPRVRVVGVPLSRDASSWQSVENSRNIGRWIPLCKDGVVFLRNARLPWRSDRILEVVDMVALALGSSLDVPGPDDSIKGTDVVLVALRALAQTDALTSVGLGLGHFVALWTIE